MGNLVHKRAVPALLALCLLLSACGGTNSSGASSSDHSQTKESGSAMGRYVEEALHLPDGLSIASMYIAENGDIEAFVRGSQTNIGPYFTYRSTDGGKTWEDNSPDWIKTDGKVIISPSYDLITGDLYMNYQKLTTEEMAQITQAAKNEMPPPESIDTTMYTAKLDRQGTLTEFTIDQEANKNGAGNRGMQKVTNGDILIDHGVSVGQYDAVTGAFKNDFQPTQGWGVKTFGVNGDTLIILTDDALRQYSLTTGEELKSISGEGVALTGAEFTPSKDGKSLILGSKGGIYRCAMGGSIWERVVEGELCSLNMPSLRIRQIFETEDGFLVWCSEYLSGDKEDTLLSYKYSDEVPTVPTSEINVYALNDSPTARQAIGIFQRANPDYRVNFKAALGDGAMTRSDAVRALNTELLAGKGPDILILDDLPIESYIEKGVLQDLSTAFGDITGELLPNIASAYSRDNALYALPARFSVPMVWASEAGIAQSGSLGNFAVWLKESKAQNPARQAFADVSPELLIPMFYPVCAPAWYTQDGIDQAKFIEFLTMIKTISDLKDGGPIGDLGDLTWNSLYWSGDEVAAVVGNSLSPADLAVPDAARDKRGDGGFALLPGQVQGAYLPKTILGLNKNSTQTEKSTELLRLLLSEQVQENDFEDGWAINQKALNKSMEYPYTPEDDGAYYSVDRRLSLTVLWPEEQELAEIMSAVNGLSLPVVPDSELLSMIQNETREFFSGGKTAQAAASAVAERARAYLSE